MAAPGKLTRDDEAELVAAYEAWDPSRGGSADDVAALKGVTRQTLYRVLRKYGVELHTRSLRPAPAEDREVSLLVSILLDRIEAQAQRIADLERELNQSR